MYTKWILIDHNALLWAVSSAPLWDWESGKWLKKMAGKSDNTLDLLPEDMSPSCFGERKLTQWSKRQGYNFFVQGYLYQHTMGKLWQRPNVSNWCRRMRCRIHCMHVLMPQPNWLPSTAEKSCPNQIICLKPSVHLHDCGLVVNPYFSSSVKPLMPRSVVKALLAYWK